MSTRTTRLLSRQTVAEGTQMFRFDKPQGFAFKPGQALDLILPGDGDDQHSHRRHTFSIVTAPHEDSLAIATRMRPDSRFKNALAALPDAASLQIEGPFGSLILHKKSSRAAVLIAGGIGITPFMSMLRHAAHTQGEQELVLLYSNRRPEDTAFLAELQTLEKQHRKFRLLATMTDMGQSGQAWSGATGLIDAAFIQRVAKGLPDPVYYVSGPPLLVEAMRDTLEDAGVDEDDIRSEEFFGY